MDETETTPLTPTQRIIVWGIEQEYGYADLAEHLGIHRDTVREHVRKLRRRFGAASYVDLPRAVREALGDDVVDGHPTAA